MKDHLIEKGEIHFLRHSRDVFELIGDRRAGDVFMILLELVYQDGRLDALLELQGGG